MNRHEAHQQMVEELDRLQSDLKSRWLDRSLPSDWNALDFTEPLTPHKTRVTLRLDSDMVRWFRKLGPGYGARMNSILRIYWAALLAGQVHSHYQDDTLPQLKLHAREIARQVGREE